MTDNPTPRRQRERRSRTRMVQEQLVRRGIEDRRVLATMRRIPRHHFVPDTLIDEAYEDRPLMIGEHQTISQPYMVALMTQCAQLRRTSRVLEIGTGSGYHTAVLARMAQHVWSIECLKTLHEQARERLLEMSIRNVTLLLGDGIEGYAAAAPYDAIVVAAAISHPPPALLAQLVEGGRMVIPLGPPDRQELTVIRREDGQWRSRHAGACRFVPFVS